MSDTQNMEQAQEVQHSPKFEDIKGYYDSGFWNAAMVKNAVKKKRITAEEYTEITGKEYKQEEEKAGALQKSTWHNAL